MTPIAAHTNVVFVHETHQLITHLHGRTSVGSCEATRAEVLALRSRPGAHRLGRRGGGGALGFGSRAASSAQLWRPRGSWRRAAAFAGLRALRASSQGAL